jgi:hypothetical protein
MSANITTGTWGQLTVRGLCRGRPIANVFGLYCSTEPNVQTYPTDIAVLAAVNTQFANVILSQGFKDLVSDTTVFNEIHSFSINPGRYPLPQGWMKSAEVITPIHQQGSAVGEMTASFVAASLFLKGIKPGRAYRGGKRIGPLVEPDTVNNALTVAAFNKLNTVAESITLFRTQNLAINLNIEIAVISLQKYLSIVNPQESFGSVLGSVVPRPWVTTQNSRKNRRDAA